LVICVFQSNAFINKTSDLVSATLASITGISKPVAKFISTIYPQWLSVSGRYNFINIARYGKYSEQSLRNGFERGFDFFKFMIALLRRHNKEEWILAFDPSHINKSGKKTYGLGHYWSGKDQRTKKGLEIGCLAAVDVENHTAFHLQAVQTPPSDERKKQKINLVTHYVSVIKNHISQLLALSNYLVVDGFFMKKDFINPMLLLGLVVITKMRPDANMRYVFKGVQQTGRGRKKTYGEKVNFKEIDKRKWTKFMTDDTLEFYTAQLYCIALKRMVRIVYVHEVNTKRYEILLCTDLNLTPEKIVQYYRLRFQIEFLIRDAKQHAGLEHCQARSKNKLHFQFNMALSTVSLVKYMHYSTANKTNDNFSMLSVKRLFHNHFIAQFIFSNLGVDLNCKKIKRLYAQCLNIGSLAA
jgi:Transposase DDE domain